MGTRDHKSGPNSCVRLNHTSYPGNYIYALLGGIVLSLVTLSTTLYVIPYSFTTHFFICNTSDIARILIVLNNENSESDFRGWKLRKQRRECTGVIFYLYRILRLKGWFCLYESLDCTFRLQPQTASFDCIWDPFSSCLIVLSPPPSSYCMESTNIWTPYILHWSK